jgi:hypothetical protein
MRCPGGEDEHEVGDVHRLVDVARHVHDRDTPVGELAIEPQDAR